MMKNWKVTAVLSSPLCEEPPKLDSVLAYELSLRIGMKHARKLKRDMDFEEVPIPVSKYDIGGTWVYRVSNPILGDVWHECEERIAKRFDTGLVSPMLAEKERKNVLMSSGSFKMRFAPAHVYYAGSVSWFVRGDRKEINKLLKKVFAIGKHRVIGYGQVSRWEYEEVEADLSIYAQNGGEQVLMRTLPICDEIFDKGVKGYRKSFSAIRPPYWHPQNYIEAVEPC